MEKREFVLQYPEQQDFINPAVETSPKKVASWLKDLPVLNLSLSLNQLIDAITSLNTQKVQEKIRIQLLDLYFEAAARIYPSIETKSLALLPISSRQREQAKEDMGVLQQVLADGYKIIILSAYLDNRPLDKSPALLLSAYRLMEVFTLSLLNAYRIYHNVTPTSFLEIHQLYLLAVQEQIANLPIKIKKKQPQAITIERLYKCIMSLSTIDPYHLSDGIIYRLYPLTMEYSDHCTIKPAHNNTADLDQYIIDLNGDGPPIPASKVDADYNPDDIRILHIVPMKEKMKQVLEDHEKTRTDTKIISDTDLLQTFVPEHRKTSERLSERIDTDITAMLIFGIDSVHHFVTIGISQIRQQLTSNDESSSSAQSDIDYYDKPQMEQWKVGNISETGYLLIGKQYFANELRVGELAGIIIRKDEDKNIKIELAVTRWMRQSSDSKIEIGVETIQGNALPVACTHNDEPEMTYNGIYIPGNTDRNITATLVMPKNIYRRERNMQIKTGLESLEIKASYLVEGTACFDQFEFITA